MAAGISPWKTAVPDWADRIVHQRSLLPALPWFDAQAEKALRIFKRLRVPDIAGTPRFGDVCREWVFDIVRAVFGSYDEATRRRMIREFFILIPKKNGKSTICAAILVTATIMNQVPRAEALMIAPSKKIADIAFDQAKGIIECDKTLAKLFHPRRDERSITHLASQALIRIQAADTDSITGSKATYILIDEVHEFAKKSKARHIFTEIIGSLAARPHGFEICISTQSKDPPSGVFEEKLKTARDVRDGKLDLPILAIIYELPTHLVKDDGWRDPATWEMVNPNLGASVDEDFLRTQLAKAERDGAAALALLASQHFNVEIAGALRADGWSGAPLWDSGIERGLTLDEILHRSEVVTIACDGGGLDDLFGVSVLGREKGTRRWLSWSHAFISPIGLDRRRSNAVLYEQFVREGDLTEVERLPDDITAVIDIVQTVQASGKLGLMGLDRIGTGQVLLDELIAIGLEPEKTLVTVPQGIQLMGAIKVVERKLADGSFKHGGRAMMNWCAHNAIVVPTTTGIRIAREASGYGKIDPLMAVFDCAWLMLQNPEAEGAIFDDFLAQPIVFRRRA